MCLCDLKGRFPSADMDQSEEGEEVVLDRLSLLPDDVLLEHILKHVDFPTAVRMSALSSRWRHVPRLLSTVHLDAYDFTPPGDTLDQNQIMTGYSAATRWLLADARHPTIINKLYLAFYLKDPYLQSIGEAVQVVVETGCRVVDLQFSILIGPVPSERQAVRFGQRFMFFFDAYPTVFRWLTSLSLEDCSLSQSAMPTLLNACNMLRVLCLTNCSSGPTCSLTLTIDAPHSVLFTLELHSCRYPRVELVHVPHLERLICEDWDGDNRPPVHFGYVPRLQTISLASARLDWRQPFSLSDWLTNARNLSVMRLNFRDDNLWVNLEGPKQLAPVFSALRTVYIYNVLHERELNWTLFVLEAAPSLKNCYIKIFRHKCGMYRSVENENSKTSLPWETSNFQHQNLRLLQIKGFAVERKVMRYIRLVIKHAINLKTIRLRAKKQCKTCDGIFRMSELPLQDRLKNLYRERLTDGLFTSVEITID